MAKYIWVKKKIRNSFWSKIESPHRKEMKKKHSKYSKWYIIICFPFLSQLIRFFCISSSSIQFFIGQILSHSTRMAIAQQMKRVRRIYSLSLPFCFLCVYLLLNPIKAISVGSQFFCCCCCWASIHFIWWKKEKIWRKNTVLNDWILCWISSSSFNKESSGFSFAE